MPSAWNNFVKENYHKVAHLPNKERLKALSEMRKGGVKHAAKHASKKVKGGAVMQLPKRTQEAEKARKAKVEAKAPPMDPSLVEHVKAKPKRMRKKEIDIGGELFDDLGTKLVEKGFEKLKDAKEKVSKQAKEAMKNISLADTVDFARLFL
jgi:hypothetical protein